MVQINFAAREVNCKIVYYGPGRSGKTTNLEVVHAKAPPDNRGELVSIATETDRTLYFDFLPLDLGKVAGMTTKFQLYTVPGQVFYNATRKLVLQGADGVIFVADSQRDMKEQNVESLNNLVENLSENGIDINTIPMVFQWNKRDLPDVMPVEELNADLNHWSAPTCDGVAVKGEGVFPTLKMLSSLIIRNMNREQGLAEDGQTKIDQARRAAPAAAPRPGVPGGAAPPRAAVSAAVPRAPGAPPRPPAAPPRAPVPAGASAARTGTASARVPTPVPGVPRAPMAASGAAPRAPAAASAQSGVRAPARPGAPAAPRQAAPQAPVAAQAAHSGGATNPVSEEIRRRRAAEEARRGGSQQPEPAAAPKGPKKKVKRKKVGLLGAVAVLIIAIIGVIVALHYMGVF